MHSDLRFSIVMAVMILWDLQDTAVIAHRVIIAHGALLLNAQDMKDRFPEEDLINLTDPDNRHAVQNAVLERALADVASVKSGPPPIGRG